MIEHKLLEKRDNESYRYSGDVNGDILAVSTPNGRCFFVLTIETSLTKTARLIDMI
jgi:hypothetical protein